jgi:hypothetical protein
LKSGELATKSNSSASSLAITRYSCILCSQIITHDKRYKDKRGRAIPLDETGSKRHDCTAEAHQGVQP